MSGCCVCPAPFPLSTLHYDARNRLTAITASPQGNETYVYDPLDNIRQTVQAGTDRRFHYAPATQRLEWIRTPTGQNLFGYQWNERGELTRRSQFTPGIVPVTPPTIFRSGFESPLIETRTEFAFDRASRMTSTHSGQIAHLYDAHGRRVRSSQALFGSRYEVYSRSGQLLHVEDTASATRLDYVQLRGQLIAEREQPSSGGNATVSYLHSDLLGSLSVKTASQGSVIYRSRYHAFGAPQDGQWRDGPGYTKHVMDSVSELVYMQQRYYDPATLRFVSTDPVSADPLNFNRFWYGNNNPYSYTDPDGRSAICTNSECVIECNSILTCGGDYLYVGGIVVARHLQNAIDSVYNEGITESDDVAPNVPEDAGTRESDYGCIYCVSGENTESGKEYVGSTNDIEARQRDRSDGRDREGAEIIGAYPKGDREARQNAEQQAINDRGGRDELDNRRNEVREARWDRRGIRPPPTGTRINRP